MEMIFGSRKTPAELLKQHQRALQKATRELDRERTKMEQQEKKLISDIKKTAKQGQMNACKVMAKDLVRTRRYIQKFYQMRTQLQAVSLRIQVYLRFNYKFLNGIDHEIQPTNDRSTQRCNKSHVSNESSNQITSHSKDHDGL